jgi:antitoxin FitA
MVRVITVAVMARRLHNVSMPNVLIRDLPEEIHANLQRRAQQHGQSLQQYLSAELRRLAERPTIEEVLDRIAAHRGGQVGLQQAVADLNADRDRR